MHKLLKCILFVCLLASAFPLRVSAQYDKDVFFMRGRHALADGRYSQAIENFNVLSQLDTTDYWTYFFRGIAKYNLGDLRGAKRDFERSVRLNPVFTSGYHYHTVRADSQEILDRIEAALSQRGYLIPGV